MVRKDMDSKDMHLSFIETSNYRVYSVGIVAVDKKKDSDLVDIYPIEKIPAVKGDVDYNKMEKGESEDIHQNINSKNIKVSTTITCKWKATGQSNRVTSPDVRKGEKVLIYSYSDGNVLWWDTVGLNPKFRRHERVRYEFGNESEFDPKLKKDNNVWWLELDTYPGIKTIQLHTNDNDKEYTTYDFKLNALLGTFESYDGKGNKMKMDSKEDKLSWKILKHRESDIGKTQKTKIGEEYTLNVGKTWTVDIGKKTAIKSPKFTVKNDHGELVSLFSQALSVIMNHTDTHGDSMNSGDKSSLSNIKSKVDSFL